jgi:hypothetical protein
MKRLTDFHPGVLLAFGVGAGLLLGNSLTGSQSNPFVTQAQAQPKPEPKPGTVDAQQLDLQRLSERVPDQAHVMVDVGYHFANLWFAADKENWPLANYYLGETRSHLKWAVRIHPVRKVSSGAEVNLNGILEAVDSGLLADVARAITNKDAVKFKAAYQQTLQGCYACHTACEKPYLHPQVPTATDAPIISFDPNNTESPVESLTK